MAPGNWLECLSIPLRVGSAWCAIGDGPSGLGQNPPLHMIHPPIDRTKVSSNCFVLICCHRACKISHHVALNATSTVWARQLVFLKPPLRRARLAWRLRLASHRGRHVVIRRVVYCPGPKGQIEWRRLATGVFESVRSPITDRTRP